MQKLAIAIVAFFCVHFSIAQDYAYSFKGLLSASQQESFEKELSSIEGIAGVKIKIKEEKEGGVILIELSEDTGYEGGQLFNAANVKNLLLDYQLTPLQFTKISSKR